MEQAERSTAGQCRPLGFVDHRFSAQRPKAGCGLFHSECSHIGLQDGFFFETLVGVLLAQADDGADRLGVVALYPCTIYMFFVTLYARSIRRLGGFHFGSFECKPGQAAPHHASMPGLLSFE
jgi:hypothetical protein